MNYQNTTWFSILWYNYLYKMSVKKTNELSDNDILQFVKYLHRVIRKFGIKKVEGKIRDLLAIEKDPFSLLLKNEIFSETSKIYNIPAEIILHSNTRGIVTEAKIMCIIMLSKHLHITQEGIAKLFGKGQSLISKRITGFHKIINKKDIEDTKIEKIFYNKSFMENYKIIDDSIINFKNGFYDNSK